MAIKSRTASDDVNILIDTLDFEATFDFSSRPLWADAINVYVTANPISLNGSTVEDGSGDNTLVELGEIDDSIDVFGVVLPQFTRKGLALLTQLKRLIQVLVMSRSIDSTTSTRYCQPAHGLGKTFLLC